MRVIKSSPCRSKIFICFPKTLFNTEDALEAKKPDIGERLKKMAFENSSLASYFLKSSNKARTLVSILSPPALVVF